MTKNTNTQAAAANLTIGQLVEIDLMKDGEIEPATGILVGTSKGWYVVELDEESAEEQGRDKVSVRAASIRPAEEDEANEQEEDLSDLDDDEGDEGDVEEALDEAEEHASKMAEALRKARQRYVKTTRPNGAATAHNGDVIAKELRDYEPEDVCKLADRIFALPIGTHLAKYEHLNNGQKRMNAGNRIRAAWRAQKDEDICQRIVKLLNLDLPETEELASIEDLQPVEQA